MRRDGATAQEGEFDVNDQRGWKRPRGTSIGAWTRRVSWANARVHKAVEDCGGQSRIREPGVPFFEEQLASDDRGSLVVAFAENFHQVTPQLIGRRSEAEGHGSESCALGAAHAFERVAKHARIGE